MSWDVGTNRYVQSEGLLSYKLREQWKKREEQPHLAELRPNPAALLPPPGASAPQEQGVNLGKVVRGMKEGGDVSVWRISENKKFRTYDAH